MRNNILIRADRGSRRNSTAAERLKKISYVTMLLELAQDILESLQRVFTSPLQSGEILGILGQGITHGLVDEIGNRPARLSGLYPQSFVQHRIEVYRRPFAFCGHALPFPAAFSTAKPRLGPWQLIIQFFQKSTAKNYG
jgi:hypothetical protein